MEREEKNKRNAHVPRPYWWIATWFGAGHSPVISGTAGSLAALPFAWVIQTCFGNVALFAAAIVMFLVGCWASNQYLRHNGGEDPREIVIDEVAGQWLLLSALFPTWESYLVGFLLFRAFDIVKPWPVSLADRKIKGGFGVMLDDILAALYPIGVWGILYWLGFGDQLALFMEFLRSGYVRP